MENSLIIRLSFVEKWKKIKGIYRKRYLLPPKKDNIRDNYLATLLCRNYSFFICLYF
jgi:hypothetical protein